MNNIITSMVRVASQLDKIGMYREADYISNLMVRLSDDFGSSVGSEIGVPNLPGLSALSPYTQGTNKSPLPMQYGNGNGRAIDLRDLYMQPGETPQQFLQRRNEFLLNNPQMKQTENWENQQGNEYWKYREEQERAMGVNPTQSQEYMANPNPNMPYDPFNTNAVVGDPNNLYSQQMPGNPNQYLYTPGYPQQQGQVPPQNWANTNIPQD